MCAVYNNKLPSRTLALSVRGSNRPVHLSVYCSIRVHHGLHHRSREDCNWMQSTMHHKVKRKNRDAILGNEDLEDLIKSIH